MSHVFPRHTRDEVPKAMYGEGCYLIDDSGKRYFDGSGGAAVSCLGHSDQEIITAIQEQVGTLAFAHTRFFTSDPTEKLANLLVENAPDKIDQVYFVSGGSEAVEASIKLARQYHLERGDRGRKYIIARRQSYHGNTLGALAVGGNEWRRKQFSPLLININHIAPCYEYIDKSDTESTFDYGQRAAQELEDEILRLGTDQVIAFIAEPVVGATLGAVPAVEGYFTRIREICDKYGVLLILDEVMCGMGRTGHLFACEVDNVTPDILCIAKGLGAGYQPIGAMLCTKEIYETIKNGSGFFQHGHTYIGHPVATAAGFAVVNALLNRGLIDRSRDMGLKLHSALKRELSQHPNVGDIRGRGLFQGIELVEDRETKKTFSPSKSISKKIKDLTFDSGLICYPMSGTRDGINGDHILLAPPYIIDDNQIGEVVEKLSSSLNKLITNI